MKKTTKKKMQTGGYDPSQKGKVAVPYSSNPSLTPQAQKQRMDRQAHMQNLQKQGIEGSQVRSMMKNYDQQYGTAKFRKSGGTTKKRYQKGGGNIDMIKAKKDAKSYAEWQSIKPTSTPKKPIDPKSAPKPKRNPLFKSKIKPIRYK